jgi:hypothetical protein
MAIIQNLYTGNGSTVLFSFSFPYLDEDHIFVSLNGTLTTAFTFPNANTVQFNTAPAVGVAIRIFRETPLDQPEAVIFAGSAIRASDLNRNNNQLLYVAQESNFEAESATTTANTALVNSTTAISTANGAVSTANTASANASAAVSTANTASSNASAAVSTANTASTNASNAVTTANTASSNASAAVSTANTALSTANAATSTANTALSTANAALSTANTAADVTRGAGNGIAARFRNSGGAAGYVYTSGTDTVYFTGDTSANNAIGFNSTGNFVSLFAGNGTERVRVTSAGLVGVGTTSVSSNLDVRGSGAVYSNIGSTNAGGAYLFIDGNANGDAGGGDYAQIAHLSGGELQINNLQAQPLTFRTSNTERLRITSAGLVGIGTSTPGEKLTVDGNISLIATSPIVKGGFNLNLEAPNNIEIIADNDSSGTGYIDFRTQSSSKVRITTSGAVGIGTTSPASSLHILPSGDGYFTSGLRVARSTVTPTQYGLFNYSNGSLNIIATDTALGNPIITFGGSTDGSNRSERARIDSSGRLLVGTSTNIRSSKLQVLSTGNDHQSLVGGNQIAQIELCRSSDSAGGAGLVANGNVIARIECLGNDGSAYRSAARIEAVVDGTPGASDMPGRLVFSTTADGASSPTERMRISSAGTVTLGGDDPSLANSSARFFQIAGSSSASGSVFESKATSTSTRYHFLFTYSTSSIGSITTTSSSTAYNTSSDYRLKENVSAVTDGITRLLQLKPSRFNFIAAPGHTVDGFIAHEAQAVVPECVTGAKDAVDADGQPLYQGIDQSKLVPLLTAALQEAIGRIESLEARLTAASLLVFDSSYPFIGTPNRGCLFFLLYQNYHVYHFHLVRCSTGARNHRRLCLYRSLYRQCQR